MINAPHAPKKTSKFIRVCLTQSITRPKWQIGLNNQNLNQTTCGQVNHFDGYRIIPIPKRGGLFERCMAGIDRSDLVFAYLDSTTSYSLIYELAIAIERGKWVVVCLAPEFNPPHFWLIKSKVVSIHFNVRKCCLAEILRKECELFAQKGAAQ